MINMGQFSRAKWRTQPTQNMTQSKSAAQLEEIHHFRSESPIHQVLHRRASLNSVNSKPRVITLSRPSMPHKPLEHSQTSQKQMQAQLSQLHKHLHRTQPSSRMFSQTLLSLVSVYLDIPLTQAHNMIQSQQQLPTQLYLQIIDRHNQLQASDILQVFTLTAFEMPEVLEYFCKTIQATFGFKESILILLCKHSRHYITHKTIALIRAQYITRNHYYKAVLDEFPLLMPHMDVEQMLLPPVLISNLELITEKWLDQPFEFHHSQQVIKEFQTQIRSGGHSAQLQLLALMLALLDKLALVRHEYAPVMYRAIVAMLPLQRQFIATNLCSFIATSTAPVHLFIDPYLKWGEVGIAELTVFQKLLSLGQDRVGWKSVQLILNKVFQSMLDPHCLTQSAHTRVLSQILATCTVQPHEIQKMSDSVVHEFILTDRLRVTTKSFETQLQARLHKRFLQSLLTLFNKKPEPLTQKVGMMKPPKVLVNRLVQTEKKETYKETLQDNRPASIIVSQSQQPTIDLVLTGTPQQKSSGLIKPAASPSRLLTPHSILKNKRMITFSSQVVNNGEETSDLQTSYEEPPTVTESRQSLPRTKMEGFKHLARQHWKVFKDDSDGEMRQLWEQHIEKQKSFKQSFQKKEDLGEIQTQVNDLLSKIGPIIRQQTYAAKAKQQGLKKQITSKSIQSSTSAGKQLPKLIAKFRKQEAALISEFIDDLQVQFAFAVATSGSIKEDQSLHVQQFVDYMLTKKVRVQPEDIAALMGNNHQVNFERFLDLLILASCGGLHTKLGSANFVALMEHMGVSQKGKASDFDSGRDSDD